MNKEFKKYVTDELLLIANNVTGEYTDKQVQQAKLELYNRGVDDKIIADIMEEKEEAFMRRLDAAARAEQTRMDKRNERNRNISYKWWELLFMFMFAPFYLFKRHYLPSDFFPKLKQLKAEKYDLKFRQRIISLLAGDMAWIFIYWVYYSFIKN